MKNHLTLVERSYIVDSVIANCLEQKDDLYIPDLLKKEYYLNLYVMQFYGEIQIPDSPEEQLELYEKYCESGEMKTLIDSIDEYCILEESIDAQLEIELKIKNSVEGILLRLGNNIINAIEKYLSPENLKLLLKEAKKINPELLEVIKPLIKSGEINVDK